MAPLTSASVSTRDVRPKPSRGVEVRKQLSPLVDNAMRALQDPRTQQELLARGRQAVGAYQMWRQDRDGTDGGPLRVVHNRLERRERAVRSAVQTLVGDDPVLAVQLAPVTTALDGVVRTLAVAEPLPLMRRREAHRAVSDVLDTLESKLLEVSLAGVTPPPP